MALFSARSADPLLQQRSADRNAELRRLALGPWALAGYVVAVAAGIFVAPWLWVGLTIVVVACTYYYADKKARADWWESVVRTIGMVPDVPELDFSTPLLRSGDERTVKSKASDATRSLALFTSTDVSRDSNGNREEADHNYTLVIYDFTSGSGPVPPRVFLSAHKRRALGLGDEHRGQFPAGVKDFDLESVELNKRFNLRCDADQVGLLHAVFERQTGVDQHPIVRWRLMTEEAITGSVRGVGRLGADTWAAVKDKSGRRVGKVLAVRQRDPDDDLARDDDDR